MAKKKATTEETTEAVLTVVQTDEPATVAEVVEEKGLTIPAVPKQASLFLLGDQQVNKELLEKKIKETSKLVIADVSDTAGYKAVSTALAQFRTTRTALEKHRKAIIKPMQDFMSDYKTIVDELGGICQAQEKVLKDKLDAIDNEKERIKKEKEAEKLRQFQARVAALIAVGAVLDPESQTYVFPHEARLFTSDLQLQEFKEDEFQELLADATECWEAEKARIAQELADKLAEEERIKQQGIEQEAEAQRLKDKRTKLRWKELRLHGFEISGSDDSNAQWSHPELLGSCIIREMEVLEAEEGQWEHLIENLEMLIEESKKPKPAEPEKVSISQMVEDYRSTVDQEVKDKQDLLEDQTVDEEQFIDVLGEGIVNVDFTVDFGDFLFEDIQVAKNFFVRLFAIQSKEEALSDIHEVRLLSSGVLKSCPELGWALIKNMP